MCFLFLSFVAFQGFCFENSRFAYLNDSPGANVTSGQTYFRPVTSSRLSREVRVVSSLYNFGAVQVESAIFFFSLLGVASWGSPISTTLVFFFHYLLLELEFPGKSGVGKGEMAAEI